MLSRGPRTVSGRKRAEEELVRKSVLLEATLDHMAQGLSVYDAEFKLVAFNQRYIELRGYPPGFVRLGMPLEEIVRFNAERGEYGPGDVEEQVRERISYTRRGKKVWYERAGVDGRIVAFRREPMPGGGHVTTYTDITERKRAEQKIVETSILLEKTFQNMSQGISVFDADLKLVAYNEWYVNMWRFPEGFIRLGMPFEEIARFKAKRGDYGSGGVEELIKPPIEALRQGKRWRDECGARGDAVFEFHRDPLPGGGVINTFTDITERKEAEQEIAEKSALLDATFENMSQGISVYDADLKLAAFNRQIIDLMDYPPGFLRLGMPYEEIARFKAERGDYGPGDVDAHVRKRVLNRRARKPNRKERTWPN